MPLAFDAAADPVGVVVPLAAPSGAVALAPQIPEVHSALVVRGRPEPRAVTLQREIRPADTKCTVTSYEVSLTPPHS